MTRRLLAFLAWCVLFVAAGSTAVHAAPFLEVTGRVLESGTDAPVPYVTVQAEGTSRATLSNEQGEYRLVVDSRQSRLKFSHIAYHTHWAVLPAGDSSVKLDMKLEPSAIEGDSLVVTARALDPGRRIIAEAIRRKRDIFERVRDYSYDAYAKLVVDDRSDSLGNIWLLTETQSTSYWQRPGKYREVITARKQTANMDPSDNLITVGEFLNFNRNRIEIGAYALVSPIADDALDHYNYYLLDTVQIDGKPAFRLEVEPLDPAQPRFVGTMHVADSTYDVLDIDVGVSEGASFPLVRDLRYRLRYARFLDSIWLPVEVRFFGLADLPVAVAGIPSQLGFEHSGLVSDYRLDPGLPGSTFGDVQIEVAKGADKFDSTAWYERQTIPLTTDEVAAYHRIDSLEKVPTPLPKRLLQGTAAAAALLLGAESSFFRFNRVEDVYLGLGADFTPIEAIDIRVKAGYAFGTQLVEHEVGADWVSVGALRPIVGFDYRLRTLSRASLTTARTYNPSTLALLSQWDPFNYYRSQDVEIHASIKPMNYHRATLLYHDEAHRSEVVNTDYRMFPRDRAVRDNPAIADGDLRSLEARWVFDSRPLYRQEGRDQILGTTEFTRILASVEWASPDLFDNDFNFTRLSLSLRRRQQTLGLGITSILLQAGASGGTLPPQRYFAADFGKEIFFNRGAFQTFDEQTFGGDRAVSATVYHNFRKLLFTRLGWPLVRDIPFWLSVHGGVLWADFANLAPVPGDAPGFDIDHPYGELGFGLENLLPFLEPAIVSLHFTWQLSNYETRDFSALFALRF